MNCQVSIEERVEQHPCYSEGANKMARIHLPVAPACNISCNYCNRKFDCVNESRPGVTSEILSPVEARDKYLRVKEQVENLTVVGIAGPGDALANFEATRETLELIRAEEQQVNFCLSTNGLLLPKYAPQLVELGVGYVTVTINTIQPEIGAQIYDRVSYEGVSLKGEDGARILMKNQLAGLNYLSEQGVLCKVNIVAMRGINEGEIEELVSKVKEAGAFITNIVPLIPAAGSKFEDMEPLAEEELNALRTEAAKEMKQMTHCQQCRADAIGTLDHDRSAEFKGCAQQVKFKEPLRFAVASKEGRLIDQHFGHAEEFLIYESGLAGVELVESRAVEKYCTGEDECGTQAEKLDSVVELVADCDVLLSLRIGYGPQKRLESEGIKTIEIYAPIKEGIKEVAQKLEDGEVAEVS